MKHHPIYVDAHERAIFSARKLPEADRTTLQQAIVGALLSFQRCKQPEPHWRSMVDALNLAEGLSDEGIFSDTGSREMIERAQGVLRTVWERHMLRDSWTLHACERQALDDGLWLARTQLDHCSFAEYRRAYESVRNRTQQALAGNAAPGTTIIGAAA